MGSGMEFVKGYTKWHTNIGDGVDLELCSPTGLPPCSPPGGRQTSAVTTSPCSYGPFAPTTSSQEHWLQGGKGLLIKVLAVACVFSVGLVLGYGGARRGSQQRLGPSEAFSLRSPSGPCSPLGVWPSWYANDHKERRTRLVDKLVQSISQDQLEGWLWTMTQDFHVAGSEKGTQLAGKIRAAWSSWGVRARVETFRPLLSYPDMERANEVRITRGSRVLFQFHSLASPLESQLETHPYLAYSSPGKVRGKPVYVNFGLAEDFEVLKTRGVTLNGTIAIMRYGRGQALDAKIRRAEENGIQGVLLYRDPFDWEPVEGIIEEDVKRSIPLDAIERDCLKSFPGDPVTPFLPATDDMFRLPRADLKLPGLPVQPISALDAQNLLKGMGGPAAPIEWQGRLNISYAIGPGYKDAAEVEVQLSSFNLFREMSIHDTIGVIPGTHQPGRYVIIGCHHDSWTRGAGDPGSGMAVLMEVVRVLSELVTLEGWRPQRTLLFAAWDASAFGQVGSTEFLQKHRAELASRTIAYVGLDQAVTGNRTLQVMASPLLRQALSEAAEQIPGLGLDEELTFSIAAKGKPYGGSNSSKKASRHSESEGSTRHTSSSSKPPSRSRNGESLLAQWARARPSAHLASRRGLVPEILPPAGGADFTVFTQLLGVSVARARFVSRDGDADYPAARTAYDDWHVVVNVTDPGQRAMAALAQLIATVALELADSPLLPMKATDYADQISVDFGPFQRQHGDFFRANHIRTDPLNKAVREFAKAANEFQDYFDSSAASHDHNILTVIQEYNERILQLERSFLLPPAYPRHHSSSIRLLDILQTLTVWSRRG
ncbi:N-acetylated-alpha-linked acidic dipeptidase-like protein isoform X2 [Varroa destructor]|uniref:Peptidase M28 domain-containing protein n=1 Tax=Varroa destructor TaxID=109461 RepID=A0A7M7MJH5_VARDE|nr:N-acetylated-alpha-linked acidic dipeptidase-like protein isoform X2 [Varroa destructor]